MRRILCWLGLHNGPILINWATGQAYAACFYCGKTKTIEHTDDTD